MGKLRSCSLDSDYIFMNPNSEPTMKCTRECLETSKTPYNPAGDNESHYMSPRSIKAVDEIPEVSSSLYNMIDMSELYAPREEPQVIREIVTPPPKSKPSIERVSSAVFLQNRLNAAKTKQKFTFPSNETEGKNIEKNLANPLQHRDREGAKTMSKKCRSLDDDDDVYMVMMGRGADDAKQVGNHPNNQLIDFNDNLSSKPNLDNSFCNTTSSRDSYGDQCYNKSESEDEIYSDVAEYGFCSNECHKELSNQGCENSAILSSHSPNLPSTHGCLLAQRRLPPRPSTERQSHLMMANGEKYIESQPVSRQITSIPPPLPPANEKYRSSHPCDCPPIPNKTELPSKQEPVNTTQPPMPASQTRETGSINSKLSTIKSKTTSLFGRNLLSKGNIFSKSQKQDKQKQNDCVQPSNNAPEKKKIESSSPKQNRKIHPIAEMMKRRRNLSQPGFAHLSSSQSKAVANAVKNSENSCKVSPTFATKNENKTSPEAKKKSLTFTNSLPLSGGNKFSVPSQPKVLTTTKSSPSIMTIQHTKSVCCDTEEVSQAKTSPILLRPVEEENKSKHQETSQSPPQKSFLFSRRGSEVRFDDKPSTKKRDNDASKQPIKRNMTRANTFDGLNADNFIAESYEVPMFLQQSPTSEHTLKSPDSDVFVLSPKLQPSPKAPSQRDQSKGGQTEKLLTALDVQIAERRSQFEKLRSNFSKTASLSSNSSSSDAKGPKLTRSSTQSNLKPLQFPTRPPPSTPTNVTPNNKDKNPSSRPPPPSLQKIREARLRKNWANNENRSVNENGIASNQSRVSLSESRRNIERSKHFSNPELLPSPEEDDEYSYIPECSQNSTNTNDDVLKNNKMKLSRNKSMGAAVSSVTSSMKFKFEGVKQRQSSLALGGSVESFESDSSLKDEIEDEGIYEDIAENYLLH